MADLSPYLDPAAAGRWDEYVRLHRQGRRKESFAALDGFVAATRDYSEARKERLVESLCRQTVDVGRDDLLRQPLLTELIFPQLRLARDARRPLAAKRIAKLRDRIVGLRGGLKSLGLEALRIDDLLREAIEVDPSDAEARTLLIEDLRYWLDYYVHEVPSGVLAKPEDFRQDLGEFEQLVDSAGRSPEFAEQLVGWRFHCHAWADYCSRRPRFSDYPDYLVKAGRTDLG